MSPQTKLRGSIKTLTSQKVDSFLTEVEGTNVIIKVIKEIRLKRRVTERGT